MTLPSHFTPLQTREHLIGMLAEAAEIEHNLMCCYLYAAFSMKQDVSEGLSSDELMAVQRWRRVVLDVAIEEMAHLTMVSNIMSAIGGAPHFGRQNFPIAAGYHPSGIVVKLAPFSAATLDHFIFLERPEGVDIPDGAGFEPPVKYERSLVAGRIMPSAQDYETVGQLYAAIADGLTRLSGSMGETGLFTGDPDRQIGADISHLPGIARVKCLKTALEAIDAIVIQGEGSSEGGAESHYRRFLDIREEYLRLRQARPDFVPARNAAHNPAMRRPMGDSDRVWISASPAADILDVANAAYNHMLRLLSQVYVESRGVEIQRALADAATDLMYVIAPLASELTKLPANDNANLCTAGISFATLRVASALPVCAATDQLLVERLREISDASAASIAQSATLADIPSKIGRIADRLAGAATAASKPTVTNTFASDMPDQADSVPVATRIEGVESVEGTNLTLLFEAKRCIHARHCVLSQPNVFLANVEGDWLHPDATTTEGLVTVAHMCPSGAIRYARKDGGPEEVAPLVNAVQVRENGPLGVRAQMRLDGQAIGMRATLCRCGASRNKPFCDGSHHEIDFTASGEPDTRPSDPLMQRGGVLEIVPETNGPLRVSGSLEICSGTGRTVDRVTSVRMCRCGHSANKPFCDNSHARIGFVAP